MIPLPELKTVVADLPEMYQPIYGHPEFDQAVSRNCEDRYKNIKCVYDALVLRLGRSARVLDLGCAQGWFSFKLAEAGAQVFGVDYLGSNINVCNMLVLENRHLQARFKIMEIEQIPTLLETDSFDMVLGLSVFHHLCLHNGKEAARDILSRIAEKIPVCLFEFALADEPTSWAKAQPEHPDYWAENIPFYYVLEYHTVHLSSIARPLYFCSYHFWYLNGELEEFTSWREGTHRRRYFFNERKVAKLFPIIGESAELNRNAVSRAAEFLNSPPEGYRWSPKFFGSGTSFGVSWLLREKIEGHTLHDMIIEGQFYNERAVLLGVLEQLAVLEKARLYHSDIRSWNIIVNRKGMPTLIDFNEITETKRDAVWPGSLYLAFFIFINEVVTHRHLMTEISRSPFISPFNLPEPYRYWGMQLWRKPISEWSFALMLDTLRDLPQLSMASISKNEMPEMIWMQSMEENIELLHRTIEDMGRYLRRVHTLVVADHQILENVLHKKDQ